MKSAIVTYSDGTVIPTSINGTDEQIKDYFAVGAWFNIGTLNDNMQQVVSCEVKESEVKKYFGTVNDSALTKTFEADNDIEAIRIMRRYYATSGKENGYKLFSYTDINDKTTYKEKI